MSIGIPIRSMVLHQSISRQRFRVRFLTSNQRHLHDNTAARYHHRLRSMFVKPNACRKHFRTVSRVPSLTALAGLKHSFMQAVSAFYQFLLCGPPALPVAGHECLP